jgi:hypothetical protein
MDIDIKTFNTLRKQCVAIQTSLPSKNEELVAKICNHFCNHIAMGRTVEETIKIISQQI